MAFELNQEVFDRLKDACVEALKTRSVSRADEMINILMDTEGVIIHCPYHHFIVPAVLLTMAALEKYKKEDQLREWLDLAEMRAKEVPGGVCGNMGNCGSAVGAGIFLSVYTSASPLSVENWKWANELTGRCLIRVSSYGGPRCCKRTCYLALMEAIPYINEKLDLNIKFNDALICKYSDQNKECLKINCPFFERHPRNSEEGCPITVPGQMMPKKDPAKDCACQYEPVDMAESTCYINWEKPDGAFVKKDEVICEAEADKKVIEFTAGCDGYLIHKIENGDYFNAGSIIGYIKSRK